MEGEPEYSKEAIAVYLAPLEGWKPTKEEKELAKERIDWLDGVRALVL
jgi:hypothetical protein